MCAAAMTKNNGGVKVSLHMYTYIGVSKVFMIVWG